MVKERNFLIHPYYILITLLLGSITALFLGFSAAYLYTRVEMGIPPIKLPPLFYINTVFLIAASICLVATKRAYLLDKTRRYKNTLIIALLLTIIFLVGQILAWLQLSNNDIFIQYSNMASYMYVISALHFVHVIAGIPFLILFIVRAYKYMKEPPGVLIYFSDPAKKRSLNILTVYWHFLDALWIYLVLFFFINYLIS